MLRSVPQPIRTMRRHRRPLRSVRLDVEELETRLAPATSVLTYHGDIASTGANATETQLTPANVAVNAFGKLFSLPVDGQVYAEPLVDTGVTIVSGPNTMPGAAGVHDVVFVATEHDSLYAIDAAAGDGTILWKRTFLDASIAANNTLGASQITTVPSGDTGTTDITVEVGITGTPVIDATTGTLYLVAKTRETIGGDDHYVQRLHAINISDGTDRVTPYVIGDTTNGNDNSTAIYCYGIGDGSVTDPYNGTNKQVVQFNALREHQRGALSLVNNTIYVEWASHGDNGPYHGWVADWDVSHLNSNGFVLKGVFNTSPNDGLSGIWQGGGRLVFEPDGSAFYFETGNGSGGAPSLLNGFPRDGNYNEALVKVTADSTTSPTHQNVNGWGLKVVDYFIPFNVAALDAADSDFGSGAPILLPDLPGHPHLMVAGGKEGKLYLLNRDNLGHFDAHNDHVLNAEPDGSGHNTPPGAIGGLLSTPAWFNGKLYVVSGYDGQAHAFTIQGNNTLYDASYTSNGSFGYLPGSPTVSANGITNGIVWILDRNANRLHAYDAATLATELWNSGQKAGGADNIGAVVKFAVPTVANGRVYVGTANSLVVYGAPSPPTAVPNTPVLSATALSGSAIRLSWTDDTQAPNKANGYTIEESSNGSDFSSVATAAAGATSIAIGGLQPTTHYSFKIVGFNGLGASNDSNVADAITTDQVALLDFSGGFAAATDLMTLNGSATVNGTKLELTDDNNGEAGSAFATDLVDVSAFTSQFTFRISPGSDTADGFAFVVQGISPTALGSQGGDLGYGGIGQQSVAIKFDLYDNDGEGVDSTGLFLHGDSPMGTGSVDLSAVPLDLHSGDVFEVDMIYDGTTLAVTILDTQTNRSASQEYTVDIPGVIGGNGAYVGFTGGTGGLSASQDILTWTYAPTATTSPDAPSGLGATPASATSVQLSWTNNATNQIGFHLDRATDADFTQEVSTHTVTGNRTTFTDDAPGLAPGNTFYYRLRAFNSNGDSDTSNVAEVKIPLAPPKPTNQQVDGVTENEIDISWQDNAGHKADGYKILRAANHGSFSQVATLPPTSRTAPSTYAWSDTDLTPGTYYEYHILAFNVSGNNDFAGVNVTTITEAPDAMTAVAGDGVVSLSWTAPTGAQSYNIYRGTSPGGEDATPLTTGVTAPGYDDTDVTIGVTYWYRVTAVNANIDHDPVLAAESASSAEVSAVPTPYPGPPTLTATATLNSAAAAVALAWTAPLGATSYNVYRSLSPGGEDGTPLAAGQADTSFIDATAIFGKTCYYTVTAVNDAGEGPMSNEAAAAPVFQVHVNFTSALGDSVPGYVADTGLAFGSRGNGLSFGWSRDDTASGVDADDPNSTDELHDSFHNLHGVGSANISWRLALPNGTYRVHMLVGDPGDTSSMYQLNVSPMSSGGVGIFRGRASADHPWLENTVTLTVTRSVLYVTNTGSARNNKIDALDVAFVAPDAIKPVQTAGGVGASVILRGANLFGTTAVQFNGLEARFTVASATQLRAIVPANAMTGPITITTPGGTAVSATSFQVAPRISGFTPATGSPGDRITVRGANFGAATAVKFHGLAAAFTVDSPTQITARVPVDATTGTIQVTTPAGTATSAATFVVAPRFTAFTPTRGPVGTVVYLLGANFGGTSAVQFNGITASFAIQSTTKIRAIVPAGATTGQITLTTPAGSVTGPSDFVVGPRLTSASPGNGAAGASVVLTGANFTGATAVKFRGLPATFTIDSSTQITAIVPDNALTGFITVTTPAGTATTATMFVVAPRIISFTPTAGKGSTVVVLNGANFAGTTAVQFNGLAAVFKIISASQIRAVVPAGATSGLISVQTAAGTARSAGNFTMTG